jgi:hypothetical protein
MIFSRVKKSRDYKNWLWLGWAYLTKKMPHAATMPIVTAVVCFLSTQNMGS